MKFKVICTAMLSVFGASAAFGAPLTIEMRDGSKMEIGPSELEMTFASNNLLANWNAGSEEIPLSEISSFYFNSSPSTVISSNMEEPDNVEVYSIDGCKLGTYLSEDEAKNSLSKGLYVIKKGSRICKTVIK